LHRKKALRNEWDTGRKGSQARLLPPMPESERGKIKGGIRLPAQWENQRGDITKKMS
jgi:hypothetical protein